jgi:hypothetical protein
MDRARVDSFIEHYGVKGMRWGVRRSRSELRSEAKARKKRTPSPDAIEVSTLKKKRSKELTDDELKRALKRMDMEKRYNSMNPKGFSKAEKVVVGILAVGTTINSVIAFSNSPAGKAVATRLSSKAAKKAAETAVKAAV